MEGGLRLGTDGVTRCWWPGDDPQYLDYHDHEWGRPVVEDRQLFEKLVLEGFQAGLAWITILRKRDRFRAAFADFDPAVVAGFGPHDVDRLLGDAGIVRHRGKIEAAIDNAGRCLELIEREGSLARFVWSFEPPRAPIGPRTPHDPPDGDAASAVALPAFTDASTRLSTELRRRGWRFVGPTTMYAFMQAMGLVNDHLEGCAARQECAGDRDAAQIPT